MTPEQRDLVVAESTARIVIHMMGVALESSKGDRVHAWSELLGALRTLAGLPDNPNEPSVVRARGHRL